MKCHLLCPFGQPAFVITRSDQLWPKERVEVVNVQQGFLLGNLYTVRLAVDVTTGRGGCRMFLLTLGPRQNQLAIEVYDLVV